MDQRNASVGLLVLTRLRGESIHIGDDVTVTVFSVRGDKVRLRVTAPRALPVHRDEVFRRLQAEGRAAR